VRKAPGSAERFRRDLVERLARTEFARLWATSGADPEVAESLGVLPGVLDEAAIGARALFGRTAHTDLHAIGGAAFHVHMPSVLANPFCSAAERMTMGRGQLLRSLLHAAMQSPREPTMRPARSWAPAPGQEPFRAALERRSKIKRIEPGRRLTVACWVQPGLADAVRQRAVAFGVPLMRYLALWVADLVDGLLGAVAIDCVGVAQTFDAASAYALPVLPSAPP